MKITHLSNSFILIESQDVKICCDPWVGNANYGGWHSFPEFEKNDIINYLKDFDIVYISHLHDDHLDTKFLKESGLYNKKFIIKKFQYNTLYNRLKSIGVNEIFELEPFELFNYNGIKLSILPQMATNSSEIDEDVEYDLDTSIIVADQDTVFFNQVDNPYSKQDYNELEKWIELNYGKITITALMAGAASEYPQAFLNIDRLSEKNKIIKSELNRLINVLQILKPNYYFAAGGTYFIPGNLYKLNSFVALPNTEQIKNELQLNNISTTFLELEGGKSVTIDAANKSLITTSIPNISNDMSISIENHKNDLYDYEVEVKDITFNALIELFSSAKINWEKELVNKNIKIEQDLEFIIYNNMQLNDDLATICEEPIGELKLSNNIQDSKGLLKIHIDIRSMYLCLIRKKVWNGTIGALCLFERTPNVFYPSVTFSLNFLIVNKNYVQI
jgi:UDP-MurNAc hydroxylase